MRRCAACRARRPKRELLRFVRLAEGPGPEPGVGTGKSRVWLDPEQVRPGRGGYCCPDVACIERALRRGGLARTLHTELTAGDAACLGQEALEYLKQRALRVRGET